jgi:CheY-like chemotaxis protein
VSNDPVPPPEGAETAGLLAVEGSRLYVAVWKRLAARLGWSLTLAEPGEELPGLLARSSHRHDLVLLSLSPADPATPELVRRLRALPDYRATPFVLATTGHENAKLHGLFKGAVDAVADRSDPAQVETTLRAMHAALGPVPRAACVEDSRVAGRRILDLLAGRHRVRLEHHTDPAEALDAHRRDPYDLVLLDWTFQGPLQGAAIVEALEKVGEPALLVLSDAEELRRLPPAIASRIDVVLPKGGIDALLPRAFAACLRELSLRRLLRARVVSSPPVPSRA